MRCFVYGSNLDSDRTRRQRGIVAFAVPDLGLSFKGGLVGTQSECEYMALLTFLRFAELNPRVFASARLEVLTDAAALVYQVCGKAPQTPLAAKFLPTVRHYQQKLPFCVNWVPTSENAALSGLHDLPPLSCAPPLDAQFAEPRELRRKPGHSARRHPFFL